jgi:hypothetical protein
MPQLVRATLGLVSLAMVAAGLCGCAMVNDTGLGLVSTKRGAHLIVNGQLLTGEVRLLPDRTGRLSFSAEKGVIGACSGSLRYSATNSGDVDLRCSDGAQVSLQTTLLGETRGYGYGSTPQGPTSLAFGLSDQDVRAFLTVPSGMTLAPNTESGALELR